MPSCGSCKNQSDYQGYKKYTKTWKNLCTSTTCKSKTPGTLQNNPKGTYEGELTCSKCDSDYCGFCGTEKSGSARFKLVSATASTEKTDTSDTGTTSGSTFWDMILDLIGPLDGEIECRVEGDKVFINKIPEPEESELWIREGINVTDDSITVTDYNPDTYNTFVISWAGGTIVLTDKKMIERFGEKILEKDATKEVVTYEAKTISTDTSTDSSTDTSTNSSSTTDTDSSTTDSTG